MERMLSIGRFGNYPLTSHYQGFDFGWSRLSGLHRGSLFEGFSPEVPYDYPISGTTGDGIYFITASAWEKQSLLQSERMAGLLIEVLVHYRNLDQQSWRVYQNQSFSPAC